MLVAMIPNSSQPTRTYPPRKLSAALTQSTGPIDVLSALSVLEKRAGSNGSLFRRNRRPTPVIASRLGVPNGNRGR